MLNKIILMGRITAAPEVRQTPSNISVCRFTVAVDRPYQKDKERQADFISVTAWRQTAEFVGKYFDKGSMIIIEGSLHNNDYTDNNGVKHYGMVVQAQNVGFGESKRRDSSPAPTAQAQSSVKDVVATAEAASVQVGDLGDFEEIYSGGDLPF